MSQSKLSARSVVYLLFIATSLLVGWFMPAYYDWTGADQSRPAPIVAQMAWGLTLAAAVAWLSLPWLPFAGSTSKEGLAASIRFSVRSLLIMTFGIAVGMVLLLKFPAAAAGAFCVAAFCYVGWFGLASNRYRLPSAALVGCTICPFVWVVADETLSGDLLVILRMTLAMPSLVITAITGAVVGQNLHNLEWLAMLLTGGELLLGTWMIRIGPKHGIAYLILVWLLSTFASFGLHALVRM